MVSGGGGLGKEKKPKGVVVESVTNTEGKAGGCEVGVWRGRLRESKNKEKGRNWERAALSTGRHAIFLTTHARSANRTTKIARSTNSGPPPPPFASPSIAGCGLAPTTAAAGIWSCGGAMGIGGPAPSFGFTFATLFGIVRSWEEGTGGMPVRGEGKMVVASWEGSSDAGTGSASSVGFGVGGEEGKASGEEASKPHVGHWNSRELQRGKGVRAVRGRPGRAGGAPFGKSSALWWRCVEGPHGSFRLWKSGQLLQLVYRGREPTHVAREEGHESDQRRPNSP